MPAVVSVKTSSPLLSRAGDIGHVVLVGPNHMGLGHIALPVRANRQQLLRRAGDEQQAAGEHRRGRDLPVEAFHPPELRAIRRRVGDDAGDGQRDDLRLSGSLDDDGRRPGSSRLARALPDDLAGAPVQRVELGFVVFAVSLVELHDQPVAPGGQGSRVAIGILQRAKALGPGRFPFEGERRAVAVRKDHIDAPAIRRHGRRRHSRWTPGPPLPAPGRREHSPRAAAKESGRSCRPDRRLRACARRRRRRRPGRPRRSAS